MQALVTKTSSAAEAIKRVLRKTVTVRDVGRVHTLVTMTSSAAEDSQRRGMSKILDLKKTFSATDDTRRTCGTSSKSTIQVNFSEAVLFPQTAPGLHHHPAPSVYACGADHLEALLHKAASRSEQ